MEDIKLIEKRDIVPEKPTERKRLFLSNIDLSLVAYHESVSFFDPPQNQISFSDACNSLYNAIGKMLVPYDFFAGRLVPGLEDSARMEIDCNGAGAIVAAAKTESPLSQLGPLSGPIPEFRQLVKFVHEDGEEQTELKDKPLLFLQITQFGCGSISLASRYNHCVMDGIAVSELETNMARLTRGDEVSLFPNPDRTFFKARNPPSIKYPHYEYSKPNIVPTDNVFSVYGSSSSNCSKTPCDKTHLVYLPPQRIVGLKKAALKDGKLKNCTSFQVVAAKIWKARSIATKMDDESISTMLFPMDARKIIVPPAPVGFSGNALVPAFARANVKELKEEEDHIFVQRVQEGFERLTDEYVRSGIDWLEVNKGVPCRKNSFSLVAWFRLGLEDEEFLWGKLKFASPVEVKPGLVNLLPGPAGGLNVCLELPDGRINEFRRILMED